MIAEDVKIQNILELDPSVFTTDEIRAVHEQIHSSQTFLDLLGSLTYDKLQHLLEHLIEAANVYYRKVLGVESAEKLIKSKLENLLDFKDRVGCSEAIEACLHEGCFRLNPTCAVRKLKEDILVVAQIFESRKNRSSIPHVAIELFFKKMIDDFNCIGVVLSDKSGSPKVFTTDGSPISNVISQGIHRLSDAIEDHEFRFSSRVSPFLVFNQYFPVDRTLIAKIQAFNRNPDLTKYIRKITFSSVGFEITHEKMIFSIIYLGDNILKHFLKRAIDGIERIKIETDPDARLRAAFGKRSSE
jgi:hypothetical protein